MCVCPCGFSSASLGIFSDGSQLQSKPLEVFCPLATVIIKALLHDRRKLLIYQNIAGGDHLLARLSVFMHLLHHALKHVSIKPFEENLVVSQGLFCEIIPDSILNA